MKDDNAPSAICHWRRAVLDTIAIIEYIVLSKVIQYCEWSMNRWSRLRKWAFERRLVVSEQTHLRQRQEFQRAAAYEQSKWWFFDLLGID